jgi:hypothetical protein
MSLTQTAVAAELRGGMADGHCLELPMGCREIYVLGRRYVWTRETTPAGRVVFQDRGARAWMFQFNGTARINRCVITVWADDFDHALDKATGIAATALRMPREEVAAPISEEVWP